MTTERLPLTHPAGDAVPSVPDGGYQPLKLDPDKYRDDLKELDLTEEEENAFLETLWNIMRTFVELGWGLDSVQMILAAKEEFSRADSANTVETKETPQASFNTAAHGEAAGKGKHDD